MEQPGNQLKPKWDHSTLLKTLQLPCHSLRPCVQEEFILAGRLAFALSYWEVISRPLESPDRQECFCQYTDFRHQSHNVIYDEGCGTRYL